MSLLNKTDGTKRTFVISDKNILFEQEQLESEGFIYHEEYARVFKLLHVPLINSKDYDHEMIITDVDGGMYDFKLLIASKCFLVVGLPKDFDYKKYAKEF